MGAKGDSRVAHVGPSAAGSAARQARAFAAFAAASLVLFGIGCAKKEMLKKRSVPISSRAIGRRRSKSGVRSPCGTRFSHRHSFRGFLIRMQ